MTGERIISAALRVYPRWYREAHGTEIAGTAADASGGRRIAAAAEAAALVGPALRLRTGLDDRGFAGQAAAAAATPGIWIAAAWSLVTLRVGEQVPAGALRGPAIPFHFGPFWTAGAAAYVVWAGAAVVALLAPRWARTGAFAATAVSVAARLGPASWGHPPTLDLALLAAWAVPALVAPPATLRRRAEGPGWAVAAGAAAAGFCLLALPHELGPSLPGGIRFYLAAAFGYFDALPVVLVLGMAATAVLAATRHRTGGGAIALLLGPLALWGAAFGSTWDPAGSPEIGIDLAVLGVFVAWFLGTWVLDARRASGAGLAAT